MAITILQSLRQSLPAYPYFGGSHTPHGLGSTVQQIFPPKVAIPRSQTGYDTWATIGRQYLAQGNQIGQAPDIYTAQMYINAVLQQTGPSDPARPRLEGERDVVNALLNGSEYIPQQEDNIRHTNEADIVRTANLYLVHPVIQALWAHPKYNGTLVSQSEDFQHGTRTDITFMKVGLNQVHRTFFILEYKRRGMIHGSDFHVQGGVVPVPPSLQQILPQNVNAQHFARAILDPVDPGQKPTQAQKTAVRSIPAPYITPGPSGNNLASTFEENPMRLITQAAAYAVHHSTRYVALFNYDNLICCYFPWLDPTISPEDNEDLNKDLAGEYPVEIEIYPSNSVEQRLALLGIMWTALENTP